MAEVLEDALSLRARPAATQVVQKGHLSVAGVLDGLSAVWGSCRGLRRHACTARRKKTCCTAFGASPPPPRDACTTRGSQTHRAARSRSTTSTPASLLVDPRPDAQDLTSRALARSRPSHVCALADEPELGGVELMVAAGMRDIKVHPPLLLALASRPLSPPNPPIHAHPCTRLTRLCRGATLYREQHLIHPLGIGSGGCCISASAPLAGLYRLSTLSLPLPPPPPPPRTP